ncbi:flagellar hook-basal body protein [Paenibacillus sp. CN-4]|uniref:flagellar hook-basal body protein n=1 Tax=Paenibacillus nanchangensis TaxID=3348343 RepID=UPI00397CCCA3
MIRGLYTAAAGLVTQQRRHDTATQNIANLNTMGYKQVDSVNHAFPEVMIAAMQGKFSRNIGKINTGVFAEQSISQYNQGTSVETGKPLDFELYADLQLQDPATGENMNFDGSGKYIGEDGTIYHKPQAFFTVQDDEGNNLYTRDGSFKVSPDGTVMTPSGFRVLDANGNPLVLNGIMEDDLKVDGQGNVLNPATGQPSGARLGISVVTNPSQLVRDGNGVFHAENLGEAGIRFAQAADNLEVRQGFLEGSNVDSTQVMVDLNAAYRAYEANQKVVQFYDSSLQKAVTEIGRV